MVSYAAAVKQCVTALALAGMQCADELCTVAGCRCDCSDQFIVPLEAFDSCACSAVDAEVHTQFV
jgi:hypothetical protein